MAPSRNFYDDDESSVTTPGLNEQMTAELAKKESLQLNKNVSLFDGMTIRSPEIVNKYMKEARLFLYKQLVLVENELSTTKTAVQSEMAGAKKMYDEVVEELVLPSLIYILTGTLSGSILVRNRGLPTRFFVPLIFGITAFGVTMPKTFSNTASILTEYEKKWPELYETHKQLKVSVEDFYKESVQFKNKCNEELVRSVGEARRYLKDLVDK